MSPCSNNVQNSSSSPLSLSLRKKLAKEHACYVLITCSHPNEGGNMHVEMTYDGDPMLAAMLIENAQGYLQEDTVNQDDT